MPNSPVVIPDRFLYFAYGANMLQFRIHMHTPTAEFVTIARLENYRLDFIRYSTFWGGPVGTIVPTANAHTWGVIWRLHKDDMIRLDEEQGVEEKKYYIKYVTVLSPHMGEFNCRSHIQKINPLPRGDNDDIPVEQWPSWAYKEVLIMGAQEHGIPYYYVRGLKKLKHNGEEGALRTVCLLLRYGREKECTCRVPGRTLRKPLKLDLDLFKKYHPKKGTFLYFAYGSNLLKKVLLKTCPSAVFVGTARLDEHQLEFTNFSENWNGCLATVVPKDTEHVWGALWRISDGEKDALEKQESNVNQNIQRLVTVRTPHGHKVECQTYQQGYRTELMEQSEYRPQNKAPSKTYLQCIVQGATECGLPPYYIVLIKKIHHNGKESDMYKNIVP